jgi:hypothetical protein
MMRATRFIILLVWLLAKEVWEAASVLFCMAVALLAMPVAFFAGVVAGVHRAWRDSAKAHEDP